MQGTGTAANPYIPENWSEFRTAANKLGAYVSVPPNTVYDINPRLTTVWSGNYVIFRAARIYGNGCTIRNIQADGVVGEVPYLFRFYRDQAKIWISDMNFENIFVNQPDAIVFDVNTEAHLTNCTISVVATAGRVFHGNTYGKLYLGRGLGTEEENIGCNLYLGLYGNVKPAPSVYDTHFGWIYNSRIKIGTYANYKFTYYDAIFLRCFNSYISGRWGGRFESPPHMAFAATDSIFDIDLPEDATFSTTGNVVNIDRVKAAVGGAPIEVTTENLTNIEYLANAGFNTAGWYVDEDGELCRSQFPEKANVPDSFMVDPPPYGFWRIDPSQNDGKPFHMLLRGIKSTPINTVPVKQSEYITVYDLFSQFDDFETNGLCVLMPTKCETTEILNGNWSLTIEHPIDPEGRWQYIKPNNIIKALGQLYIIKTVTENWNSNNKKVTAKAVHIFYVLNDYWIDANRPFAPPLGKWGDAFEIISTAYRKICEDMLAIYPDAIMYPYSFATDRTTRNTTPLIQKWNFPSEGHTLVELITGKDGIIGFMGGELHRDNFYFSILEKKEGSKENAFELRVGLNLKGISRVVDFTTFATFVDAYDNYGNEFSTFYTPETLAMLYPRPVKRSKSFKYDFDDRTQNPEEIAMGLLGRDADEYFSSLDPLTTITIDIDDVRFNPDFEGIENLPRLAVGDSGKIYDSRLNLNLDMRITETVTDCITGQVKKIKFGNSRSFVGRPSYSPAVNPQGAEQQQTLYILDASGAYIIDTELVSKIQSLGDALGADKMIINSGYRCPAHDISVKGNGRGQHTLGKAADVKFYKGDTVICTKKVACMAQDMGFTGIGNIDSTYTAIHLDIRTGSKWYGDEAVAGGTSSSVTNDYYTYYKISKPSNERIKALQAILNSKGAKLDVDGICGTKTLSVLRSYNIMEGDSGDLTKWVQEQLTSKGYDCGQADGIAGAKTMNAIAEFQRKNGLGVGYLGGKDWDALVR